MSMLPILEKDGRVWALIRQVQEEQATIRGLRKLLWAVVRKQGGEVRLRDLERGLLVDDWQLIQSTDPETTELVIKAR